MTRWIAACSALLLLAAIVWWLDTERVDDTPQVTVIKADSIASSTTNPQALKQVEVASSERVMSTTNGVISNQGTLGDSTTNAGAQAASRQGCLREESGKSDDEFELNAALRNEGAGGESSSVNKQACFAAVGEIKRAWWMLDSTPTQTVVYNPRANFNWHGRSVQEIVLHELCSGDQRFDATTEAKVELFFVTSKETTRILVGPNWVSDGTIRSPLTEEQYANITTTLSGRRRNGIGPSENMPREMFDQRMKDRYFNRLAADEEAQQHRNEELRSAQRRSPTDCME